VRARGAACLRPPPEQPRPDSPRDPCSSLRPIPPPLSAACDEERPRPSGSHRACSESSPRSPVGPAGVEARRPPLRATRHAVSCCPGYAWRPPKPAPSCVLSAARAHRAACSGAPPRSAPRTWSRSGDWSKPTSCPRRASRRPPRVRKPSVDQPRMPFPEPLQAFRPTFTIDGAFGGATDDPAGDPAPRLTVGGWPLQIYTEPC